MASRQSLELQIKHDDEREGDPNAATASTHLPLKPWQVVKWSYLREAQAYMLISMPTGTSTIFGAFQAIRVSPGIERDIAPGET
jgi:hypothetical protein